MFSFTNKSVYGSHPITLYKELEVYPKLKGKWLEWEPEVFLSVFPEITMQVPRDKLLAIQATAANTRLPCMDHVAFESVGNCFCNYYYLVGESLPLDVEECFYTVQQIRQIAMEVHKIPESDVLFIGEIPGYIAAVAKLNHDRILPIPLSFGQDILDFIYPNYVNYQLDDSLQELVSVAREIESAVIPSNKEEISKILDNIDKESPKGHFMSWLLGCYLYDPTVFAGEIFEKS